MNAQEALKLAREALDEISKRLPGSIMSGIAIRALATTATIDQPVASAKDGEFDGLLYQFGRAFRSGTHEEVVNTGNAIVAHCAQQREAGYCEGSTAGFRGGEYFYKQWATSAEKERDGLIADITEYQTAANAEVRLADEWQERAMKAEAQLVVESAALEDAVRHIGNLKEQLAARGEPAAVIVSQFKSDTGTHSRLGWFYAQEQGLKVGDKLCTAPQPIAQPASRELPPLVGTDNDPSHPQFVAGFKVGHKAGRNRGAQAVAAPDRDAVLPEKMPRHIEDAIMAVLYEGLLTRDNGPARIYRAIRAAIEQPSAAPADDGSAKMSANTREIIEAAEAIVARWYSPKWKDEPHTAVCIERLRAALSNKPADDKATDSMGMPVSCGKPLCSPCDHHPLCDMHKPAAPPAPQAPDWQALYADTLAKLMICKDQLTRERIGLTSAQRRTIRTAADNLGSAEYDNLVDDLRKIANAPAEPTGLTIGGKMIEIGRLECSAYNGLIVHRGDSEFVTISGLSQDECRALAPHFGDQITVHMAPAPSTGEKQ